MVDPSNAPGLLAGHVPRQVGLVAEEELVLERPGVGTALGDYLAEPPPVQFADEGGVLAPAEEARHHLPLEILGVLDGEGFAVRHPADGVRNLLVCAG